MQIKEMREFLRGKVDTVPRSNKDVELLYRKMSGDVPRETIEPQEMAIAQPTEVSQAGEIYTYVGGGDTPPQITRVMGIQDFVRGAPTLVTDQRILAKIGQNSHFVKGEVNMDKYFAADELAAKQAQAQREEDQKLQIMVERQNRKG